MELGLELQEQGRQKQQHREWSTERIMHLDNQMRAHNLKLRSFLEGAEDGSYLNIFVAICMSPTLQLEEGVIPFIDMAYRLVLLKGQKLLFQEIF